MLRAPHRPWPTRHRRARGLLAGALALVAAASLVGGLEAPSGGERVAPAADAGPVHEADAVGVVDEPVRATRLADGRRAVPVNRHYRSQARAVAKRYGLTIRWVRGDACRGVARSVGCYTSGVRSITLSTRLARQPRANVRFVVAHEAAHHRIYLRCGTTRPPVAAGRPEHVTDAYAAKVLSVRGATGYGYRRSDVVAARKIARGVCWSKQRTVTVASTGAPLYALRSASTRYTLSRGARLTLLGRAGDLYVVRDSRDRLGRVRPIAWTRPTRTIVVRHAGGLAWPYGGGPARWMRVGERYGYLRPYDRSHVLARAAGGRLVLVERRGF
ncbi:hypothetical protein [Isoptericola sp. NPDC057391]|uniref:hypothetical protein n=1 Tax=Isoptericola sp. NPDC057391 TaxID=3346117 RepID=UPI0036349B3F